MSKNVRRTPDVERFVTSTLLRVQCIEGWQSGNVSLLSSPFGGPKKKASTGDARRPPLGLQTTQFAISPLSVHLFRENQLRVYSRYKLLNACRNQNQNDHYYRQHHHYTMGPAQIPRQKTTRTRETEAMIKNNVHA